MKKEVLLFNKNKIFVYSVSGISKDGSLEFAKLTEVDWENANLGQRIGEIKESYGLKKVSVLISDNLSYIASLEVKSSAVLKNERDVIESKVPNVFPYDVSKLVWDYKLIKKHADLNVYQVVAIDKDFLKHIRDAFDKVDLEVEIVEPVAYSLARVTSGEEQVHISVYSGEFGTIFLVVYKGSVVFSATYETGVDVKVLFDKFKAYAIEKFEVESDIKVISNVEIGEEKVEVRKLNPLTGTVLKRKKIGSSDRDFLFIPVGNKHKKEKEPSDIEKIDLKVNESHADSVWDDNSDFDESDDAEDSGERKKLFMMVGALIFLMIVAGLLIYTKNKDKKAVSEDETKAETATVPVKEASPEPVLPDDVAAPDEATPESELNVNLNDYKILIQNGAGIAGAAGNGKALLEKAGFSDIDVGNADHFGYEKTEITYKEGIPQKVFDIVKDTVGLEYAVEFPIATIDPDDKYDVIVTIGSLKAENEE